MTRLDGLRLLLADDHSIVRMGFRLLLEGAGAHVVAEADSAEQMLQLWPEHQPDVLIMDVSMPGLGGLAGLERLRAHVPTARVLMLSAHADVHIPARALQAGAAGYLSKRAHPDTLVQAVADVAAGRRHLDAEIAPQLALAQLTGHSDPAATLTSKEFTVFLQLAQGRSVAEVAETLKLSPSTVGTHLYHIKQKLGADNGAALALIAVRAGLVEA